MSTGGHTHGHPSGWRALDFVVCFALGVAAGILLVACTRPKPPAEPIA